MFSVSNMTRTCRFQFVAVDQENVRVAGAIDSSSEAEATRLLAARGLIVLSVQSNEARRSFADVLGALLRRQDPSRAGDCLPHFGHWSRMLKAGLTLPEALLVTAKSARSSRDRRLAEVLRAQIRDGLPFHVALVQSSAGLDAATRLLVATGEESGQLADALEAVATSFGDSTRARRELRAALTYPTLLVFASATLMTILLVVVAPSLRPLAEGREVELSGFTRALFAISDGMSSALPLIAAVAFLSAAALAVALRSAIGRRFYRRALLSLPGIGPILALADQSKLCASLGLLLRGGLAQKDAVDLAAEAMSDADLRGRIKSAAIRIGEGCSLSEALTKERVLSDDATEIIRIGEQGHALHKMLLEAADGYNLSIRRRLEVAVSLMGPLLIVAIGIVILVVVLTLMDLVLNLAEGVLR